MTADVTSLSLFHFPVGQRVWAFLQMGLARRHLERTRGLRFWKLLGAGRGRFSVNPDWSRYGLLAVWDDEASAADFFASSSVFAAYRRHTDEIWTTRLRPLQAHGAWSGVSPFRAVPAAAPDVGRDGPIAVLTRATIDWRKLLSFWGAVPGTSDELDGAAGLIASIGLGEAPPLHQATFSLWRSADDLRAFAYGSSHHREVIRRTRDEKWYSEQLFARFVPIASEGTWNGLDPLRSTDGAS